MRGEGRASMYRPEKSPPRREFISHQLDEHANRIKQLLRADLNLLQQENTILKAKCKKVSELEDKVQMIMKQNSQLLSENDRLSKLVHQKKAEFELVKDKYEAQLNQKMGYAAEFELERKKMLAEIDRLQSEIAEIQHLKSMQVGEVKAQLQIEIQSIRRQAGSAQQVYEQEIRKLREQLDKKEFDIAEALNKLKRFSSDSEYETLRLREEKEKLRNELVYLEEDRRKELQALRGRLQANYTQQLEHTKRSLTTSLLDAQSKNLKLRELLQSRNQDIEQLTGKASKQKAHYQEVVGLLKKQNQSTRTKLIEFERLGENEKDSLKSKLSQLHEAQLEEVRLNNQKYIQCLQTELHKLETLLTNKQLEIEQLLKDKSTLKITMDADLAQLKQQHETITNRAKAHEAKLTDTNRHWEQILTQRDNHITYLERMNQTQLKNNQDQLKLLKELIQSQKAQLDSERLQMREKQQYYKQALNQCQQQNEEVKDTLRKQKANKGQQAEQLQNQHDTLTADLKSKLNVATARLSSLEKQTKTLKDSVSLKQKEFKALQQRASSAEEREQKLERDNDELRNKLVKKDQKCNEMLVEQKNRLEASYSFTLESLKTDHEEAMRMEKRRYSDMLEKLAKKDEELAKLLKAYEKLRTGMEALTEQEANRKEMTLKIPGATADIIATKHLFDVFLKAKVLDVCGDAQQPKENNPGK